MACASASCAAVTGACCVPVPQGASNMLGFVGGHPCCAYPCIQFPPYSVQICLTVNSTTQVTIEQGCPVTCLASELLDDTCNIHFSPGQTVDSWGKRCRTISWNRSVPAGAYIRIRFCAGQGCPAPCVYGTDSYSSLCGAKNSLLKFSVNGSDFVSTIQYAAGKHSDSSYGLGSYGCRVKAACIGSQDPGAYDAADGCCQWYTFGTSQGTPRVSWGVGVENSGGPTGEGVANLPVGTEIVLGPIGGIPNIL